MIENIPFRCFKCNTKDDDKNNLTTGEYILFGEPSFYNIGEKCLINKYSFFGRTYNASVWLSDIKYLLLLARKGIQQLEQAAFKTDSSCHTNNYSEIRIHICELCLAARNVISWYKFDNECNVILKDVSTAINDIVSRITRVRDLPDYVLFNSSKRVDQMVLHPSYNFLHLYLDLKWISMTIDYQKESDASAQLENFEENLHNLLVDLIHVGIKKFDRGSTDLQNCTPYLCSCFKELWLLLQLFVEELYKQRFCQDFWNYFNKAVKEVINIQNSSDGKEPVCCLWLLCDIAKIQGYDSFGNYVGPTNHRVVSNYILVEQCLKSILQASTDEKRLRVSLQLIASLQVDWWTRDATFDLLQLQWEHFYKRIHTSFAITSDNTFFINTSQKLCDFVSHTESILNCDLNSSMSYDIFLYLLSFFLKRNPTYWSKLKGRIYSKLSASKLATFNDTGLQNLVVLLLTLAHSVNFTELSEKLLQLLNQLPANRCEDNAVIWSAHISLVIMYIKRDLPIRTISATLINLVEQASANRSRVQLMKLYIDGLSVIVENLTTFQCSEHVLFASNWLKYYLQWCSHTEACNLLELLVKLVDKIKLNGIGQEWSNTFNINIVPSIIQLSNAVESPTQVAEVAAAIVSTDCQKYTNVVEQMTGDTVNVNLVEKFLRFLFERADVHQILMHQTIIIQAWIRITMLTINQHNLFDVTQIISRLPQWTDSLGCFNVFENEDPLYVVIKLAGTRVKEAKNISEIAALKRWFETYFGSMDKWTLYVLNSVEKTENSKLLLRIYTCGALLFIHCAPALYTKNKTTSLLYRLVSTMLLPTAILMNKRPPDSMLAALRMTWHLFVRGVVRLDYRNDTYIERILKDIVIRYVPHFNDFSSPIIRCLDPEFKNEDTIFIVDKIVSLITYRSRTATEFSPQAVNLILEMIKAKSDGEISKIKILVEKSVPALLEQLMFVENRTHKQVVLQVFEGIKNYSEYINIREIVKSCILTIIDKHLAFYSSSVFQMLEVLSRTIKTEIQDITIHLKDAVQKVERMRGVGYDNTLRKGLQDIQEILKK